MSKKSRTREESRHLDAVAALGCIACRTLGHLDSPAEIHHIRSGQGLGQRASHAEALPLCPHHHRQGGHGEAFHAGKRTWQARFGTERELLAQVRELLGVAA